MLKSGRENLHHVSSMEKSALVSKANKFRNEFRKNFWSAIKEADDIYDFIIINSHQLTLPLPNLKSTSLLLVKKLLISYWTQATLYTFINPLIQAIFNFRKVSFIEDWAVINNVTVGGRVHLMLTSKLS